MATGTNSRRSILPKISEVHLTWKRHLQEGLVGSGITLQQSFLLRQLSRKPFLYPSDIATMLHCDRPTASVVIRNLQKHGWADRSNDPDNGKRTRVSITPNGRRKLDSVRTWSESTGRVREDPLDIFNAEEIEQLAALLRRLHDRVANIRRVPRAAALSGQRAKPAADLRACPS